jgi:hypothetical protein
VQTTFPSVIAAFKHTLKQSSQMQAEGQHGSHTRCPSSIIEQQVKHSKLEDGAAAEASSECIESDDSGSSETESRGLTLAQRAHTS